MLNTPSHRHSRIQIREHARIDENIVAIVALAISTTGAFELRWSGDIPALVNRTNCKQLRNALRRAMADMVAAAGEA